MRFLKALNREVLVGEVLVGFETPLDGFLIGLDKLALVNLLSPRREVVLVGFLFLNKFLTPFVTPLVTF